MDWRTEKWVGGCVVRLVGWLKSYWLTGWTEIWVGGCVVRLVGWLTGWTGGLRNG
jgi:hypothetical protein